MGKVIDFTGKRFGKLVVLCFAGRDNMKMRLWRCKCDCGNYRNVVAGRFNQGTAKSCGCINKFKDRYYAAQRKLFFKYRQWAKYKNHCDFDLSLDEFIKLVKQNCYYCGCKPYRRFSFQKDDVKLNGLDRVDHKMGYVLGNVVPCCTKCNYAKHVMSLDEYLVFIEKSYRNLLEKGFINGSKNCIQTP